MKQQVIVLAGGNGTRLGQLTQGTQKCLLPIDGIPVLGHIICALQEAFGKVDLLVGIAYQAEQVIEYVTKVKPEGMSVTFIPHTPHTEGWGIYKGMQEHIRGPFIAMPGDIITLPSAYEQVLTLFLGENVDGAITLSPDVGVVDTHGVGSIEGNRVTHLQWPTPSFLHPSHMRDMTLWASDQRIFSLINRFTRPGKSIGYVFMDAINAGIPIAGKAYTAPWIHIGYPHDLQKTMRITSPSP